MATELYAAGRVIGNKCFEENREFLKCKAGDKNPTACLDQGTEVHKCVYGIFKEVNSKAGAEFKALSACLDDNDLRTHQCKKYQAAFEAAFYGA